MASKRRRHVTDSQGRAMIANVYHFLKEEYQFMRDHNSDHCDLTPLANLRERTAQATGVGYHTVARILKEENDQPSHSKQFISPMTKRKPRKGLLDIENISPYNIRSIVLKYQAAYKETPTIAGVQYELKEKFNFTGCYNTTRNALIKLGIKLYDTEDNKNAHREDNRKALFEDPKIQVWRYNYLKKLQQYRLEGRPIVYTGVKLAYKTETGICYTIVHAGTKYGFIKKCLLIRKASANGENEFNLSHQRYSAWIADTLLPNLPQNSVVVIGHGPYNDKLACIPNINSKKEDIVEWLTNHSIPFDKNLHKIELYDILDKNKGPFTLYKTDEFIHKLGFHVLRTPPYHPELNAMEAVLDRVLNDLKRQLVCINLRMSVMEVLNTIITLFPVGQWAKCFENIKKIEQEYMEFSNINLDYRILSTTNNEYESDSNMEVSDSEEEIRGEDKMNEDLIKIGEEGIKHSIEENNVGEGDITAKNEEITVKEEDEKVQKEKDSTMDGVGIDLNQEKITVKEEEINAEEDEIKVIVYLGDEGGREDLSFILE